MQKLHIKAPAKLNLFLNINGIRQDGYHLMQMVMQSISLYDKVKLELSKKSGIFVRCNKYYIPTNERNIAYKAAAAFYKYTKLTPAILINIKKNIPSGAGMGGGSADAAAVLTGMNMLYKTELNLKTLCNIGEKIGADVPFCLTGSTALVEGIGEIIKPIKNIPDCFFIVIKPGVSINTKKAFAKYDENPKDFNVSVEKMLLAIENEDLHSVANQLANAFEDTIDLPIIDSIKQKLINNGALNAVMTGSGSAVFGIFEQEKVAINTKIKLKAEYKNIYLCKPINNNFIIY